MNSTRIDNWAAWEEKFQKEIVASTPADAHDPAHDIAHFKRVVTSAKAFCAEEGARAEVVIPAAWLHDLINVPKNDPRRSQASRLSGEAATVFLKKVGYPAEYLSEIAHAIEAHSFSANIEPRTVEAMIVQDADRLDGLGAIGIARVFAVAGLLKRPLYHSDDPFARTGRKLNDLEVTLDHFYTKLFLTAQTLRTRAGKKEGERRVRVMQTFLQELGHEIGASPTDVRIS